MSIEVREVDPFDDAALRGWWEIGAAASAERPIDVWPAWEVSRTSMPAPRGDGDLVLVTAVEDGRVRGAGMVFLFRSDNTHLAAVEVYVAPGDRRRGIGRAVLTELEQRARADGRTTVIASAFAPLEGDDHGSRFATALGYSVASHEENKVVDLAAAAPTWGALDAEVADALGAYRVEVFEDRTPDPYVADLCTLLEEFIDNVPTGDLDLQRARWTPERLREGEERARRVGRTQIVAVAVAPTVGCAASPTCGSTERSPGTAPWA